MGMEEAEGWSRGSPEGDLRDDYSVETAYGFVKDKFHHEEEGEREEEGLEQGDIYLVSNRAR
jgi:NACalpha-BTF3-like transcription factor